MEKNEGKEMKEHLRKKLRKQFTSRDNLRNLYRKNESLILQLQQMFVHATLRDIFAALLLADFEQTKAVELILQSSDLPLMTTAQNSTTKPIPIITEASPSSLATSNPASFQRLIELALASEDDEYFDEGEGDISEENSFEVDEEEEDEVLESIGGTAIPTTGGNRQAMKQPSEEIIEQVRAVLPSLDRETTIRALLKHRCDPDATIIAMLPSSPLGPSPLAARYAALSPLRPSPLSGSLPRSSVALGVLAPHSSTSSGATATAASTLLSPEKLEELIDALLEFAKDELGKV